MNSVLYHGYEHDIPWTSFLVQDPVLSREQIDSFVRIALTNYITARRKANANMCMGDFITYLRREKEMIVNQDFNTHPERIDL